MISQEMERIDSMDHPCLALVIICSIFYRTAQIVHIHQLQSLLLSVHCHCIRQRSHSAILFPNIVAARSGSDSGGSELTPAPTVYSPWPFTLFSFTIIGGSVSAV